MSVKNDFSLSANNTSENLILDDVAKTHWRNSFPNHSPNEVYNQLTENMPTDTKIAIDFKNNKLDTIKCFKENSHSGFNVLYRADANDSMYLQSAAVRRSYQGNGIAKTLQKNAINLFMDMGMKEMTVWASEAGTYAWGKMGFKPDNESWLENSYILGVRLSYLTRILETDGVKEDEEYIKQLEEMTSSENPETLWKITEQTRPFPVYPNISWGKAIILPKEYLPVEIRSGIPQIASFQYTGKIDFNASSESMIRATNYLGLDNNSIGRKNTNQNRMRPQ